MRNKILPWLAVFALLSCDAPEADTRPLGVLQRASEPSPALPDATNAQPPSRIPPAVNTVVPGAPHTFDAVGHAFGTLAQQPMTHPAPEDPAALATWVEDTREALASGLVAVDQVQGVVDEGYIVLGSEQFDGYRRDEISYFLQPMLRTRAFLFVPDAPGPHAGVVFWHGHGDGGHYAAAGADGFSNPTENDGARRLAEAGFVVLAPMIRSFHAESGTHAVWARLMSTLGTSPTVHYLQDARTAVSLISTLPEVDAERVGMTGVSLGGYIALLSAALDTRIRATSVHAFFPQVWGSFTRQLRCPCTNEIRINRRLEFSEFALLVSPRHLQVVAGIADTEFPIAEVRANMARAQGGFAALGTGEHFEGAVHGGGHEWVDAAIPWLQTQLSATEHSGE